MVRCRGICFVALAVGVSCVPKNEEERLGLRSWSASGIDSLRTALPGLMSEYRVPGVAIALTSGDTVQWAAGFGRIGPSGELVTPETVFQVASLSKPVFAHVLEKVRRRGNCELTDRIGSWSRVEGVPSEWLEISPEALLSHTSGLRYDSEMDRVILDESIQGTWSYSGAGYVFLQKALESAEGSSLEHLAASEIFQPWGLQSMTFVEPHKGNVATGHDRSGTPLERLAWSEPNAASSLYSNVLDYARFMVRVTGSHDSTAAAPSTLTRRNVVVRNDLGLYWGVGWALEDNGLGSVAAFHWGANPGFKSFALVDLVREKALVIVTNGDHGLELVQQMVAILDEIPHPLFQFYMLHPDD